jgi:HD superfamily phosphodiesterase
MKEIFERIWELALPYQDKRDDAGHAETTLHYAQTLAELENANEDVIIPAIILHDIGWSQLPRSEWLTIFDNRTSSQDKRSIQLKHQGEGVRLARDILTMVAYSAELTGAIVEIISEHDTRQGFISKDEGLVRDADKLWRFSRAGFEADAARQGSGHEIHCKRLEDSIKHPAYFYSEAAKHIALKELESRKT